MALFKMRKGGDESPAALRPETVEAMRRRARHRLIGAAVLVLIGVMGFPLLFDTQPRPIAVDIPIEIPDRNKVKPLTPPRQPAAQAPSASGPVTAAPVSAALPAAKPVSAGSPAAESEVKAEAKADPKPESKAEPKVAAEQSAAADARFVVQVGAFADPGKAREARLKLERAGLNTYTHVAETKDGKRIRVRVGPFGSRGEADKAADKIKGLDLPANILTL
jgi:DedD protein